MFFITGLGMILYATGTSISGGFSIDWANLMFAGALLATLFWVSGYNKLTKWILIYEIS